MAALTSMCRFYYANLFKNVLACNLEGLQLDIDRFWEYVGKHFLVRHIGGRRMALSVLA